MDFPVVSPIQAFAGGSDAFVTKFGSDGAIAYSTYLGGASGDTGWDIAVDYMGRAVVVGKTSATTGHALPITTSAAQEVPGGGEDGFVATLDATGSGLLFSTYLGGREMS